MKERQRALLKSTLDEIQGLQKDKLSSAQLITYRLFHDDIEHIYKGLDFPFEYMSFNQMDSRLRNYLDDSSPQLTAFPFDSVKHYEDYLKRSEGFLPYIDRQISWLREGARKGYALNCQVARNALVTYKDGLEPKIEKNPFFRPVLNFPKTFSEAEKEKLKASFKAMIETRILPGFKKFDQFYRQEYLPKCRKSYGLNGIPNAESIYRYQIRGGTDLDLDPKQIHEIGLKEVARISQELKAAFAKKGLKGNLQAALRKTAQDPKNYFSNVKDIYPAYEAFQKKVMAEIPKAFSLIPKTDFKLVEAENSESASGMYQGPTEFAPYGRFVFNAKNLKSTSKGGIGTLFLHEAIPGHHFQFALQFELKDQLSEYQRKMFFSNAFAEGWALYSERWGREAGLVDDPDMMIASLSDEMLRAVRLVVDTGIHAFGWSREQAIRYMSENLPNDARETQIEADRYSVWPGQALGYKIGQLKILELRDLARRELGDKFDIKAFHRVVIGNGTVSLPVLEEQVKGWIFNVKTGKTI